MRTVVFNGWAAGPEAWRLCDFERDCLFDYVEQLDGLPARMTADFDAMLLVGFSMGGASALAALLAAPDKVKGLVLVSATARMMEDRAAGWAGMSARRLEALSFGTRLVYRDDPSPLYAPANLARGLDFLVKTDLREPLRELVARTPCLREMPVAIFQSERDGIVRPANADFLRALFPQAEVTLVPGSEHILPIAVPELIDETVERFQRQLA